MKNLFKHIRQSWKAKKGDQELISVFVDLSFIISSLCCYLITINSSNESDYIKIYSALIIFSIMRLIPFYLDINHFKTYYKELISKIRAKDYDWDINLNIVFLDSIVYLMILLNFLVIVAT